MRQRFRARELWLFAPVLLIITAFCFMSVKQVWAQEASGVTISDIKIETTSGLSQYYGWSRRVTVKVSHSNPKPKWWGGWLNQVGLDPVDFEHPNFPAYDPNSKSKVAGGGVLLVERDGKSVVWRPKDFAISFNTRFDGENYIFEHGLKNSELDQAKGEITFRGIYRIAGGAPFEVKSVIRRADETLPPVPNKDVVGQLLSVDARPFYRETSQMIDGTQRVIDDCMVYFLALREGTPNKKDYSKGVNVTDLEVRDEKGVIYRDDTPEGFGFAYGPVIDFTSTDPYKPFDGEQLRPGEALTYISVRIAPATATSGELTLSGQVSLDSHWPIPFEIKLPTRSSATDKGVYDPAWNRPKRLEPVD